MAAAHESSEHAGFVGSASLEAETIEQLHDDVVRIARGYPHAPPLAVFIDALRVRNLAYRLLDRTRRPNQETDLYLIVGQACGLLASVSFDLGYRDAAAEHSRAAMLYGRHIRHDGLRAWARGMQALIAYWSGRPAEARELARDGYDYAPEGTARVRLLSIEARACSHLGDSEATGTIIRAAEEMRGAGGPDDLHDEVGGEFGFDAARQARCNGSAWVQLGQAEPAIRKAEEAIRLYQGMSTEYRSVKIETQAHADLAAAHLLRDDFDGACAALAPVFMLPVEHRIEGLTQRLGTVRSMLTHGSYRTSREARHLGEQIEDFVAQNAGTTLPPGSMSIH